MKFQGTADYVATEDLTIAVNAAVTLQRPLLVKGEPGTGKTELAKQVSQSLGLKMIEWNIKSTTRAQQGLYEYDAVSRLRDSQLGEERVHDVRNYIRKGKLWQAFEADERVVLLIDEIDKADIEFPNDLLQELDKMEFFVYETGETIKARHRPVVIITSNNEKELPDAFLRRCFFHYIRFPEMDTLQKIVEVHHPGIKENLLTTALTQFYEIREQQEKTLYFRSVGLAQAAAGRRHGRGRSEIRWQVRLAQTSRGAFEKRTGRSSIRATGVHGPRATLGVRPRPPSQSGRGPIAAPPVIQTPHQPAQLRAIPFAPILP